jgi:hypothetical protein
MRGLLLCRKATTMPLDCHRNVRQIFKPFLTFFDVCLVIDVLHRLNPSFRRVKHNPTTYVDPDPRKQAADARHLAKYVFPRQFGLQNPFSLVVEVGRKGPNRFPNFEDREEEIKVGEGRNHAPFCWLKN